MVLINYPKVICQGRKGLNLPLFSNFDTYCPFIQNLFGNLLSILAWSLPGWWRWTVKRRIWLNHSKGHCQGQKGPVWLIFTYFSILISSIEVLPKCITSCCFSEVIIVLFLYFNGVDWFSRSERSIWTFVIYLDQYLINGACCDQCLYWTHIQSHIWSFSWPCDLWPWINFKGQIKVTDLSRGVSHKWCIIWAKFVWNTYNKSYMGFQFTLQHSILTFDEIERANQGHWLFSGIYFIN